MSNPIRVFISHLDIDHPLAESLAGGLRRSGLDVWTGEDVFPGENWASKTAAALQNSDAMVVLLTPDSVQSPTIGHEIGYALGEQAYKGRLVPVIARQADPAQIPWILRKLQMVEVDGPEDVERSAVQIADVLNKTAA